MKFIIYFKVLLESSEDYREIVLIMSLIQNFSHFWRKCGFLKNDNSRLSLEFKKLLIGQNEEYLDHIKI